MKKIFNCEQKLTGVSKIAYRNLLTTFFSLALITTSCTDEADTFASKGASLQLEVKTAGIKSRGLIESTTLPDGHSIGLSLVDAGGSTYDNISYQNIQATASTGATPQTWTLASDMLLSSTSGTLYGYYPHSGTVDDITQVPVTAGETDYMYATPVTGINENKNKATVTMNHALTAIRVQIQKEAEYIPEATLEAVKAKSSVFFASATMDATTGMLSGQTGNVVLQKTQLSQVLSTTAHTIDFLVVPGTEAADITFTTTVDGQEYIATAENLALQQGAIYTFVLTLTPKEMKLTDITVNPWNTVNNGNVTIQNIWNYAIKATYQIDEASTVSSRSTGTPIQLLYTSFDLTCIDKIRVDGKEVEPALTYSFDTAGEHKVEFLLTEEYRKTVPGSMFKKCGKVTEIVIPEGVTEIGNSAFSNCMGLSSVTIPEGVTELGEQAFEYCTGLSSVTIPEGVTSIGNYAFKYCARITGTLTIPESCTNIGSLAFYDCTGLTSIVVDAANPIYDSRNNCNAIMETATDKLIFGCKNTVIPEDCKIIGESAFDKCTGLTSITIPNSVNSIENGAFLGCMGLTNITINESVTSIGSQAFSNCTGLINITIPNSVTSIGSNAFESCDGLTSVNVGSGVTSIGEDVFNACRGLTSIVVDAANPIYDSRNNCNAIMETATDKLIFGCKNTVIPEDCKIIGESAFYRCTGITGTLTIPESCTNIGEYAFSNCTGLTGALNIPNSVTSIGSYAFEGCMGLTSLNVGSGMTSIGSNAFRNCRKLANITSKAIIAPTISNDTFYKIKAGGALTVPTGATGYDVWMGTDSYYLGSYSWTLLESSEL